METMWHSPSYLYFGPIGAVTTFSIGLIVSLLTGKEIKSLVSSVHVLQFQNTVNKYNW